MPAFHRIPLSAWMIAGVCALGCDSTTTPDPPQNRPASLIAFDADRSVYTIRPDGTDRRLVAKGRSARRSGNLSYAHPRWSPDGAYLAYVRYEGEHPGVMTLQVSRWDGSDRHDVGETGRTIPELAWASTGDRIVFGRLTGGEGSSEFYGGALLYTIRPDGTDEHRVPSLAGPNAALSLACPSWSPDGNRVAFVDQLNALWTAKADGTDLQLMYSGTVTCAAWSPDGSRLAFVNDRNRETYGADGRNEILMIDAEGGGLRRLTQAPNDEMAPLWSPDGSRLAFQRWGLGGIGLFTMRPDGTDVTQIASDLVLIVEVTWSPDGRQLAFISGNSTERDIQIVNIDGTGLHKITNTPEDEATLEWR